MKTFTLPDILTDEEIDWVVDLYDELGDTGAFVQRCYDDLVEPILPRICVALDQEMNGRYICYAIQYILGCTRKPPL